MEEENTEEVNTEEVVSDLTAEVTALKELLEETTAKLDTLEKNNQELKTANYKLALSGKSAENTKTAEEELFNFFNRKKGK